MAEPCLWVRRRSAHARLTTSDTPPSHAGRSSKIGSSGRSRTLLSSGASGMPTILPESRARPGYRSWFPGLRAGPDIEEIRRCVLKEWAVPILRAHLVFDIQGEVIDAAAARRLLPGILGEGAARFVEAAALAEKPAITLPELQAYPKQELVEKQMNPSILEALRTSYSKGDTVTVRVPVLVSPSHAESSRGYVDLHLAQAGGQASPVSLRLRHDITVPRGGLLRADGVHSALLADAGPVAEFLADAEPPAHDTWTVTGRLKEHWKYAPLTLNLIRTAPARLHQLLAVGAEKDLPDELLQYFSFEDLSALEADADELSQSPDRPLSHQTFCPQAAHDRPGERRLHR